MKKIVFANNKGSAMILLTAALTVILTCSAIVMDVGNVVMERQKMQNAVDAAALAAAFELPDTVKATETARHYAQINGVDPLDIGITFKDSNKTVVVKADTTINFVFAKIMGIDSTVTGTNATATLGSISDAFNYTIFSGSTSNTLTLNGSGIYVTGSSHSNKNFIANGSDLTITGACEACSTITINGSNIDIDTKVPNSPFVAMPDFSEKIRLQAEAAGQLFIGNKIYNGSNMNVDSPIYVDGNVTVNGSNFTGKGCILATGNITFNGSNLNSSGQDAVCFYSKNGNIIVNGSNVVLDGILYAPNGSITMNGSNQTVHGRVLGKTLVFNGSNLNIIGGTSELNSLPSSSVRLVE